MLAATVLVYADGIARSIADVETIVLRLPWVTDPKPRLTDRQCDELIAEAEALRYMDRTDVGIDPEED